MKIIQNVITVNYISPIASPHEAAHQHSFSSN